jgi:hypothetical protein
LCGWLLLLLLLLLLSFVFKEQYMELSTSLLPDTVLYGLGEAGLTTVKHDVRV